LKKSFCCIFTTYVCSHFPKLSHSGGARTQGSEVLNNIKELFHFPGVFLRQSFRSLTERSFPTGKCYFQLGPRKAFQLILIKINSRLFKMGELIVAYQEPLGRWNFSEWLDASVLNVDMFSSNHPMFVIKYISWGVGNLGCSRQILCCHVNIYLKEHVIKPRKVIKVIKCCLWHINDVCKKTFYTKKWNFTFFTFYNGIQVNKISKPYILSKFGKLIYQILENLYPDLVKLISWFGKLIW
jgi:hypothetical protein